MKTLTDRFGRHHNYLRISLTDRCNLRCTYCMPANGISVTPNSKLMTAAEIVTLARLLIERGVDKIRLTGGEPTLRPRPAADDRATARHPRPAHAGDDHQRPDPGAKTPQALRAAGLDDLTISLDTLRRLRFMEITRRDRFADVQAGIEAALAAGFCALEAQRRDDAGHQRG